MIKKVIFTAALLVPSLAYAGNPSANVTVQVVPASNGIACDIGPNYTGSIPAPAQAAGFTHCAANYDFTTATYANPATWIDCKGASPFQWTLYGPNCGDLVITTDATYGGQVLDVQWQMNDFNGSTGTTSLQTSGPSNDSNITHATASFPTGKYVETESRIPVSQTCTYTAGPNIGQNVNCILVDTWSWPGNGNAGIEWDFIEMYTNSGGNGGNGGTGSTGGNPAMGLSNLREPGQTGYDPTTFHTYGWRIADDTSGDVAVCNYLDGTLLDSTLQGSAYKCATGSFSPYAVYRNYLIIADGPQSVVGALCGGLRCDHNFTQNGHYYVRSVRVWECPGYKTGDCPVSAALVTNGGALTGSP